MTDIYRRVEFDVLYLYISRPDLRIDGPRVELAILHEMAEKSVEDI